MKKFYIGLTLLICGLVYAASECREYAINIAPGELYFVELRNVSGGAITLTNNVDFMWYPELIETMYSSATDSTNSFVHIVKHVEQKFQDTQVVTNDFGNTWTNYVHALTNTVTTYVTNTVSTWTNTAAYGYASVDETYKHYIQKGDLYRFNFGNTNAVWLRYSGRR